MLRIPHCLDNRLTDSGKVVSPTHRQHFTPQKHYFSASGTHFCYRMSEPQGLVQHEGLGKLKNFIRLIGSQTCNLPACSIVPHPLPYYIYYYCMSHTIYRILPSYECPQIQIKLKPALIFQCFCHISISLHACTSCDHSSKPLLMMERTIHLPCKVFQPSKWCRSKLCIFIILLPSHHATTKPLQSRAVAANIWANNKQVACYAV
jgi:hypothetical protein